jgi:hypothetical protein
MLEQLEKLFEDEDTEDAVGEAAEAAAKDDAEDATTIMMLVSSYLRLEYSQDGF